MNALVGANRTGHAKIFSRLIYAIVVLAVYFIAGKLGLSLAFVNSSATAVWPPTGIVMAALLILGSDYWPVITIGSFLVNYTTTGVIATSLSIAVGNTIEAYTAAYLIRKFAGGINAFDTWQNTARFGIVMAVPTIIAATVGATTLLLGGLATSAAYVSTWLTWWLGDFAGGLLFAPAIILLYKNSHFRFREETLEKILFALLVIFLPIAVFSSAIIGYHPETYLSLVLLSIIGVKYSPRETSLAGITVSMTAIMFTLNMQGPFVSAGLSQNTSLLLLQSFISIITLFALTLSSAIKAGDRYRSELTAERNTLDLQIKYMTAKILESRGSLDVIMGSERLGFLDFDIATDNGTRNVMHDQIYGHQSLLPRWGMDTFYEHVLPQDRRIAKKAYDNAYKTGKLDLQCRIRWPDKTVHKVKLEGRIFYDENHRPFRVLSTVTELKGHEWRA